MSSRPPVPNLTKMFHEAQTAPGLSQLVHNTQHAKPPRIVLHGRPKIGKSTFGAGMPGAIFQQFEDGLSGIDAAALPLCHTWNDAMVQIGLLCNEQHQYQTYVMDTADWCERLIHHHVCQVDGATNIEKAQGGYGKGYVEALRLWKHVLNHLDWLNQHKGMIILVICHSRVRTINDPMADPYDSYQLKLHSPKSGNGSAELLTEWSDMLLYCDTEKFVRQVQVKQGDEGKQGRGTSSDQRLLFTQPSPAYTAGSRYPLPPKIDFSWAAVANALANPQQAHAQGA